MHRLIALVVALVSIAVSGALGIITVLGQTGTTPSAIPTGASVVAQGVSALPEGELAWRVTRATIPPTATAPARDLPGFLLVDSGVLLVTDEEDDDQARLAAGEAVFIPVDAEIAEEPLGDPLSYYRIDLVEPEAADDPGNDEMVFVGNPFPSPGGERDFNLAQQTLAAGQSIDLALEGLPVPALLMVTAGEVGLVPASNPSAEPVPLPAGQGAALGGDVVVSATGADATYVLAVVGPDVEEEFARYNAPTSTPVPTATPVPQLASLTLRAVACPVAYEGESYGADCVDPLEGITFSISGLNTGATFEAATGPDGYTGFSDLPADTYAVSSGIPGEFTTTVIGCDTVSAEAVEGGGANVPLAAGATVSCTWYAIPEDLQGDGQGSVSVSVHYCPGTPVDPFADCVAGDPSGIVISGPVNQTLGSDGTAAGLPFGSYFLQPGGIAAPDGYGISEVRGSAGGSGNGWSFQINESTPDVALQVILVPGGATQPTPVAQTTPEGGFNTDSDADGVSDAQEATLGTDPANPDTDGDGVIDSAEVAAGTDPLTPDNEDGDGDADATTTPTPATGTQDPGTDSDGDGLTDMQEANLGTNPNAEDSDGDHLPDGLEAGGRGGFAIGTDPANPDTDGDGATDAVELANDTDPLDPASN